MNNILVTGGAGFIGANFVHLLSEVRSDWKVTVLDLLTYAGNLENIYPLINDRKIEFIKANIVDADVINEIFQKNKFDSVVHFAAESHVDRSIHAASEFVLTNVLGTQNVLQSARQTGVKKFVHVSTDEVYGSAGPGERFVETTPLDPSSPYSASKAASDLLVLAAGRTYNYPVMVTRCTNNYGPYQFPEKLIPLFITNALEDKKLPLYGDGMNERSWVYVTDHCEAILSVLEKGAPGEIYNIGGGPEVELTNKFVTEKILSLLGKPSTLVEYVGDRPAHDRRYAIDYSKIKEALGWYPKTSFEEGMSKTIDWYKTNKNWWERIKSGAYLEFYEKNYSNRSSK